MQEWLDDFKTAVAFLTRLPMPHPQGSMPPNFVRAHRMFPVVGALIGAAIGLFCLLLRAAGLPDLAAAALALGAGAILTGALHEDGLAANAGQPDPAVAMVAIVIALIIALLALSWANMFWAALVTALSAVFMAWLARRQIGGQTGDVLGAAEQVAETAVLLLLAARFG